VDATTLFIVGLFLMVGCAVLVGELLSRLGQAALIGQLMVGVVLGPTLLGPVLGLTQISSEFTGIEILATFFVLMTAGLAITPEQIAATGLSSGVLGIALFLVPFLSGAVLVHLLYPSMATSTTLFVSLTISITALPVLGVMLREFNLLKSRFGTYLLNAALVNELAAVTTFSVLLRVRSGGEGGLGVSSAIAVATVGLFLASILAVHNGLKSVRGTEAWGHFVYRMRSSWHSREGGFALLMVAGLAAALYSQTLGLTFLVGAFYAGIIITPANIGAREHRQITRVFDAITWGFFIPVFFALVGFSMNLRELATSPAVLASFAALCVFAFLSKVFVGEAVSRSLGWPTRDALGAGFLIASRGAVELAMATILLTEGVFTTPVFTIVAGVGLVTTLLAPIGARPFVRTLTESGRAPSDEARQPWVDSSLPFAAGEPEIPARR